MAMGEQTYLESNLEFGDLPRAQLVESGVDLTSPPPNLGFVLANTSQPRNLCYSGRGVSTREITDSHVIAQQDTVQEVKKGEVHTQVQEPGINSSAWMSRVRWSKKIGINVLVGFLLDPTLIKKVQATLDESLTFFLTTNAR
ncbi:hypothetical protein C1H46_000358 [Malus baccata]|uniref:Uncharacterized protein n=1 Tax=Malus baccata TaxID=106549 RepID=A0A540NSP7_MALBA|nr:hypothetical protein C1H46_000358 [Malus baccata]